MIFFEEEKRKINNAGRKLNAGERITNYQLVTEIPDKRELLKIKIK